MQATISEKIISYLLWLQERGQIWLPSGSMRPDSEEWSQNLPEPEILQTEPTDQPDSPADISASHVSAPNDGAGLVISAGSHSARVLVLVDCLVNTGLVAGAERDLLLNLLRGLSLDLKSDVFLCGLKTGLSCESLAAPEDYRKSLEDHLGKAPGIRVVLSLGGLIPRYLWGDEALFSTHVDQWSQQSLTEAAEKLPVLFCWHPRDYLREPGLKKASWTCMQKLHQFL